VATLKMISRLAGLAAATLFATTAHALPVNLNLVSNGSFEEGNSLFASGYVYAPDSNTAEGQYTVRNDPAGWNPYFISTGDHTSGTGQMMVVNGSPDLGAVVWSSQPIQLTKNTDYFFEAFVKNVCCIDSYTGSNSASSLKFSLKLSDGTVVSLGTITTNLDKPPTWQGLSTQYYSSGFDGSVVLSLINQNTIRAGNDFAIDDIYFGTQSTIPPTTVPEPLTLSLLAIGLLGIGFSRRKKA